MRTRLPPLVLVLLATLGCAGPMTPLGAVYSLDHHDLRGRALSGLQNFGDAILSLGSDQTPTVRFDPPRQVLHGPHRVKLIVDDPRGIIEGYELVVRYHGHDVTQSFLMQARVSSAQQGRRLLIDVPSVRLAPGAEHLIEVGYRSVSGRRAVSRYQGPICRAFGNAPMQQGIEVFKLDASLLQTIESISLQAGFSPAFTAALIAQESSFDPRSVSWARALGLTQVTPMAETEISDVFRNWPRYPGINDLPAPLLKALVMSGKVNAANEWRLHPERSIRGGLAFAKMLGNRWLDSESFSKISWTGASSDSEVARTRLILASYNSGYSRVAGAISRHGSAWITAPELKEARKYVNRIFSYCDAFQQEPGEI